MNKKNEIKLPEIKTFESLVDLLGTGKENDIRDYLESGQFIDFQAKVCSRGMKQTCERCNSKTLRIYPKDVEYLIEKSDFPSDWLVLCDKCATIHVKRLFARIEARLAKN